MDEGVGREEVIDFTTKENDGLINGGEWSTPDSMIVYDYASTPRLTDILPSTLNHLCIPIDDDWLLDGSSLVPDCIANVQDKGSLSSKKMLCFQIHQVI